MFTTPMTRLFAVVLSGDADRVTQLLLQEGVLHFMAPENVETGWERKVHQPARKHDIRGLAELRKQAESILASAGLEPGAPSPQPGDDRGMNLDQASVQVNRVSSSLNSIQERQRSLSQEIHGFRELQKQVRTFGTQIMDPRLSGRHPFITIRVGSVPAENRPGLEKELSGFPSALIPVLEQRDTVHLFVVIMKRDEENVASLLARYGWKDIEVSDQVRDMKSDISGELEARISTLDEEHRRLEDEKLRLIESEREDLERLIRRLRLSELSGRIQDHFRKTSRTVLFSGWLPSDRVEELVKKIRTVTENRCYVEWHEPREMSRDEIIRSQPPVQLSHSGMMKPFQMLVTNYGFPEYGSIDPTFFVMFSYLAMFGLMFSDVGQGAVIILAGVIGTMIMRRRRKKAGGLFPLFIWCGASSVLFGLLFGSYFGMSWAPALLFDFHGIVSGEPHGQSMVNDLFDILAIAIWFGIGIISVGLLFNWLNLARKRSWLELLVTQRGLAGGWMFGGGVYAAWYMVKHGYSELPETGLLLLLVGVPAAVLFLKPTVFRLARGGSGQGESSGGVLNLIMEGIVEILEVFSGYLSNSLSFLRVAGLGIAHASLMIAFFELARMASTGGGYGVGAIVILIMGNLLVIGLEGLSAGVQALRLNYYEFFTKFFRTSGSVYRPISMK